MQRQNRTEAAIDELKSEDQRQEEHEVFEGEHVSERDALRRGMIRGRRSARARVLDVHREDQEQRDQIKPGRYDEGCAQTHCARDGAADHGTERRAEALRGLHQANRLCHPPRRC